MKDKMKIVKVKDMLMPPCMMPDGGAPCESYSELYERAMWLEKAAGMCFEDSCKPSGKISKKTALELLRLGFK